MTERKAHAVSGVVFLLILLGLLALLFFNIVGAGQSRSGLQALLIPVFIVLIIFLLKGLFIVPPNQARVLTFYGKYTGTVRDNGIWFVNPLAAKSGVSLKVVNFQSPQLKVNDAHGNPIEIAAVVVWRVVDTAKALFEVENY